MSDDQKSGCIAAAIVIIMIGVLFVARLVSSPSGWGF